MKTKTKTTTFDFSGYATKVDIKCADGRVIKKDAFKGNDGQKVPLVWQHQHNSPENVLGHAILENRDDGVYAYCKFNSTDTAKHAKELVENEDIKALSIYANDLKQKGSSVIHGSIKEVSLVLAGANAGAFIDNITFAHGDGTEDTDDTEAIISAMDDISLDDVEIKHSDDKGQTVQDVFNTFTEDQKNVVYALISHALEENEDEVDDEGKEDVKHSDKGGSTTMKKNVFDKTDETKDKKKTLTHAQIGTIFTEAQKCGSLKDAVLMHAGTYGIDNIDILFPDAQTIRTTPDFIKRDMEWVGDVMSGTRHTPFSRIKSVAADITPDAARAKGYITGNKKTEEVFALLKRETYPTTFYKKQKLDRNDIIDITSFDVVAWLKSEMRMMLDEEIARAVLIGDGRSAISEDKINETCIRPIYTDDELYALHVKLLSDDDIVDIMDSIVAEAANYEGSGNPAFYTSRQMFTRMLLLRDTTGHRLYKSKAEVAEALNVSKIVTVPQMTNLSRTVAAETLNLVGILVNLNDYSIGADKGGQVSMFDDFDIDYNQYKYLIEGRCSGALTLPKSAIVFEQVARPA